MTLAPADAIVGCLLGTAVGDALGLPREGLSRQRQERLFGTPDRHRLLFGRGMVSDDTDHACMTAQALIASGGDPDRFLRHLARELRLWVLALPAGVGLATLRAAGKLLVGVSPQRSGVRSAGNGACMRSPILGVCHGHDAAKLAELVRASTRLTHTDPRAEGGALAVALAAGVASRRRDVPPDEFRTLVIERLTAADLARDNGELLRLIDAAAASASAGDSTPAFAAKHGMGRGVSGYVLHTVPVVLHAWLRYGSDFRTAIVDVIRCGGDTDTTAAITGGIIGAAIGRGGLPAAWIDGIADWPRTTAWIAALGDELARTTADGVPRRPPSVAWPAVAARNVAFLAIVLAHGFRRAFPPY
jgi:ADP-ribosylglycohydrolase